MSRRMAKLPKKKKEIWTKPTSLFSEMENIPSYIIHPISPPPPPSASPRYSLLLEEILTAKDQYEKDRIWYNDLLEVIFQKLNRLEVSINKGLELSFTKCIEQFVDEETLKCKSPSSLPLQLPLPYSFASLAGEKKKKTKLTGKKYIYKSTQNQRPRKKLLLI